MTTNARERPPKLGSFHLSGGLQHLTGRARSGRVGSGRVGSGEEVFKISLVGSGSG